MNAVLNDADLQQRIAGLEAQQKQAADRPAEGERTYLAVPFKEKDAAKALGARWDRQAQSWYVPPGVDRTPFAKWTKAAAQSTIWRLGRISTRPGWPTTA